MLAKLKLFFKNFLNNTNPKRLEDLPTPFREALALHNVFLAFGIPENDIYVAYMNNSNFQVIAYQTDDSVLFDAAAKTRREFVVDVAILNLTKEVFVDTWNKTISLYNNASTEERIAATENTESNKKMLIIVTHMLAKGFKMCELDPGLFKENPKEVN